MFETYEATSSKFFRLNKRDRACPQTKRLNAAASCEQLIVGQIEFNRNVNANVCNTHCHHCQMCITKSIGVIEMDILRDL